MISICQARQKSDSMVCTRCNRSWNVNDENPPNCKFDLHFDKCEIKEIIYKDGIAKIILSNGFELTNILSCNSSAEGSDGVTFVTIESYIKIN